MKKKVILALVVIGLIASSMLNILADSVSVSQSTKSLNPDGTATVTISTGVSSTEVLARYSLSGNISVSSISCSSNGTALSFNGSCAITVKATAAGSGSITFSGDFTDVDGNDGTFSGKTASFTITNPSSGGSTGGGSTTTPTTPSTPSTPVEVKESYVSSIEVISSSSKRNGESLNKTETEIDKYDYSYTLPVRIDAFKINATPLDDSTTLTYTTDYSFADGEASLDVTITAVKDSKTQTYKFTVNKTEVAEQSLTLEDTSYQVYEDDRLDSFMNNYGFAKTEYKDANDITRYYYVLGSASIQLIVDDNQNASWVLLDENQAVLNKIVLLFDAADKPFIVTSAPQAEASLTLIDAPYDTVPYTASDAMKTIDADLVFDTSYQAWSYENGYVVYGHYIDGENSTYFYNPDDHAITLAILSFDRIPEVDQLPWIIAGVSGVFAIVLLIILAVIVYKSKSKGKKKDKPVNSFRASLEADKQPNESSVNK